MYFGTQNTYLIKKIHPNDNYLNELRDCQNTLLCAYDLV